MKSLLRFDSLEKQYARLDRKFNWSIGTKLRLMVVFSIIGILAIGIFSVYELGTLKGRLSIALTVNVKELTLVDEIKVQASQYDRQIVTHIRSTSPEGKKLIEGTMGKMKDTIDSKLKQLEGLNQNDTSTKTLVQTLKTSWMDYQSEVGKVLDESNKGYDTTAMQMWESNLNSKNRNLQSAFDLIIDNNQKVINNSNDLLESMYRSAWINTVLVSLLVIVISVVLSIVTNQYLTKQIRELLEVNRKVADGELRVDVPEGSHDELGRLTQSSGQLITNLRSIIEQVQQAAAQVASASEGMSQSSAESNRASEMVSVTIQEVAEGTVRQVERATETSRLMQGLTDEVNGIQATVDTMVQAARETTRTASAGREVLSVSHEQMGQIRKANQSTMEAFENLHKELEKIVSFVDVINEISRKTNLLALNAAIEAARAGQHGRGFAVVAGEVRKLAEQSTQSANNIRGVVEAAQNGMKVMSQAITDSNSRVQTGEHSMVESAERFAQIDEAVQHMVQMIDRVSSATQQIAQNSNLVLANMDEVAAVIEQSSAGFQEVSAATEEQLAQMEEIAQSSMHLHSLSEQLQQSIARFRI